MNRQDTVKLICSYIVSIGLDGRPNGHIYADMMAEGIDLDTHNAAIQSLKEAKLAEESNHFVQLTELGKSTYLKIVQAVLP